MARNLYERVEVLVPLQDELLRERAHHEILDAYLADNRKARILLPDGNYIRAWQPVRGKRNEPAYVARVVDALAAAHGVSVEDLARLTSANFHRLFRP